jgi:hypothetical protein
MLRTVLFALVAAPVPDAASEVRGVYRRIEACVEREDCDSIIAMLAPEFHYTALDGQRYDRATTATQMREFQKLMRNPKGKVTVDEVRFDGREATAWITMDSRAEVLDRGKWTPFSYKARYIETLRREAGKWLFTASFEAPLE